MVPGLGVYPIRSEPAGLQREKRVQGGERGVEGGMGWRPHCLCVAVNARVETCKGAAWDSARKGKGCVKRKSRG